MNLPYPLAQLNWTEDGRPISEHFGDIYYSRDDGMDESRDVFLRHNQLEQRWQTLLAGDRFCIAETGFGTGLNFLCAWQLWDRMAPADARLHFVSVEISPLSAIDLQRAHGLWPELTPWSTQLLEQYTSPAPGWQHFVLANGRITLTLMIGDALQLLPYLDAKVDAWFLDGFAPAKNPDMWQSALYRQMARLARPGTTIATFTSAEDVRQGLTDAGFKLETVKAHDGKRELLTGRIDTLAARDWTPPWFNRPPALIRERRALIIGAGLAGCSTAFALAQRGWAVTVIERHAGEAREASGNPQGILYCKLSPHQTPLSRFVQTSYAYSLRILHQLLAQDGDGWAACGVLQLSGNAKEQTRLQALATQGYPANFLYGVNSGEASRIAGVKVANGGLFFPEGGWVNPPAFCRALLLKAGITLSTCQEALTLQQRDARWHAIDEQGQTIADAAIAIICSAGDSQRFTQTAHLPLKTIRGQITHLRANAQSQALRSVLCGDGYVSPARGEEHFLGASFRFDRSDTEPSVEENVSNLALLSSLSPEFEEALAGDGRLDPATLKARAALRCTTPDYLPLIGPVVQAEQFREDYAALAKDASKRPDTPSPWHTGLYINAAHGSRGLISCPLSGEIIAALLENEPMPLPSDLMKAVHPNRFLLRQLIRGT